MSDFINIQSNYRLCLEVPNALTSTWYLDSNGVWSGETAFQEGLAVLSFELNSFSKSTTQYQTFILNVKDQIDALKATASSYDIAYNLAIWMNWGYNIVDGSQTHKVRLTGQPAYVFDRFYKSAALIDPKHKCFAVPSISFDKSNGNFVVQYQYSEYTMLAEPQLLLNYPTSTLGSQLGCCFWTQKPIVLNSIQVIDDSKCMLPTQGFGYKKAFDSSHFSLRYNINSLMTAFAVNMGITPYDSLKYAKGDFETMNGCQRLTDTVTTAQTYAQSTPYMTYSSTTGCTLNYKNPNTNQNDIYTIQMRMDPKFPNMDPIYCLKRSYSSDASANYNFDVLCMVRIGDSVS